MPVGEMLRRMSSRELSEWMAYWQLQAGATTAPSVPVDDDPQALSEKIKKTLFKET